MEEIIFEKEIKNSKFELPKSIGEYFFMCKISVIYEGDESFGSGFFIKLTKDNKPLYCLMTNEHIIKKEMIKSNQIHMINVSFDNGKKQRNIILDKSERFMKEFTFMNIDATIIEILVKDNINFKRFITAKRIKGDYSQYKNKKVIVPQYPHGGPLYYSIGTIKVINQDNHSFSHLSTTSFGSSGSPIFIYDDYNFNNKWVVIGIHSGTYMHKEQNYGFFIDLIIKNLNLNNSKYIFGNNFYKGEIINGIPNGSGKLYNKDNILIFSGRFKDGKKIGFGTEYFKNSKIKYRGNFHDNKYDGLGILFYFEGSYYKGEFKNGLKHGKGAVYDEKNKEVYNGFFENGDYIGASPYRCGNYGFEDDDNILNKTVYNWSNRLEIEKPEKTLYKSKSDYDIF